MTNTAIIIIDLQNDFSKIITEQLLKNVREIVEHGRTKDIPFTGYIRITKTKAI